MKIAIAIVLLVLGLVAAYLLHVPTFKFVSGIRISAEERAYPLLSQNPQSESYEIARLVYGEGGIWFNQQEGSYLIVADPVEPLEPRYTGQFVIYVGPDGHPTERRRFDFSAPSPDLESDSRYVRLNSVPERKYAPTYSFEPLSDRLDLVGFEFTEFAEWPYLHYFIPVIPFDWKGIGYFRLTHNGEPIHFQLPTDFFGGFLYLTHNLDGQLYLAERQSERSDVAFLTVAETAYHQGMDGREIHREAYGIHVIRPRQN